MTDNQLGTNAVPDERTKVHIAAEDLAFRDMPKSRSIFGVSLWDRKPGDPGMGRSVRRKRAVSATVEAAPDVGVSARRTAMGDPGVLKISVWTGGAECAAPAPAAAPFQLTANESERFLRIISQTLRIKRHYELFQLLQGEVQHFISHQIMISAWGDFGGSSLKLDVVSAIPGVRTGRLNGCDIASLLKELHVRWLAHGRQPMLFNNSLNERLTCSPCNCALHQALQGMESVLVHGVHDVRDGFDSLYLALNPGAIVRSGSIERFRFLVDPIVAQIDAAFRRVAALERPGDAAHGHASSRSDGLSEREEEVLEWLSEGRSNADISEILSISAFTVKNHVQRIMKKLGAANRTEAVAKYWKYRQESAQTRGASEANT
jgi:transcriptional regulator EpsA